MFSNFSYELKQIINESRKEMQELGHSYIGTEHLFLALLNKNNKISKLLNKYGLTYSLFKNKIIENIGIGNEKQEIFIFTPLLKKIFEDAIIVANEFKLKEIEIDLIIKLILDEGEGVSYRILCEMGVDVDELYNSINNISILKSYDSYNEYGFDLTERVQNGLIDPVIGRERETNQIIEILLRKNKSNPLLIGSAGVGKTAVVESLARRIVNSDVPNKLLHKRIISISMASLVAGTKYRGEFEEKLINIIKKIEKDNNVILFIDEIHTLVGAGGAEGAIDASNILKPALARGNISIIGATTTEEYRKHIEDDKALSRRFQTIMINEPNDSELFDILKHIKNTYENHHNVIIPNNILKTIMNVSKKYLNNRKEPDRSIDLLDEVSSMISSKPNELQISTFELRKELLKYKEKKNKMINNNDFNNALKYRKLERKIESKINNNEFIYKSDSIVRRINPNEIIKVINSKFNTIIDNKKEINKRIMKLKNELKNNKEDINKIVNNIKLLFNSNNNIDKPISMLFINSDKKIIEKIGELFFDNIINVDLNEYNEEQSYNKIVGSAPGYIGYNNKNNVFESLKEQPFNLIILNNYENSCNSVKNIIKEIIKKGFFIDNNGYKINFLNSLIIINANEKSHNSIGFTKNKRQIDCELKEYVRDVIYFDNLKVSMV